MFQVPDDAIRAAARAARGGPGGDVGPWTVATVPYTIGSPTTAGLFRVTGGDWSLFVKIVQSFRHWPLIHVMPPELRRRAVEGRGWRYELDLYESAASRLMPPGLRLPDVLGIVELADDRVALILEDVVTTPEPWDIERFARAGRLLGRVNVRMTGADGLPALVLDEPAAVPSMFHLSRLLPVALPLLADDTTWAHPLLAGADRRRLRADMIELSTRIPAMLDVLRGLPQLRSHGDACPANLLVPADEPDVLVAIDWTIGAVSSVGDDLGQLLVGLAHDGVLGVGDLPSVHDVVSRAYTGGLADEGLDVDLDVVRFGMDAGLVVRSAFTALPLEELHGDPGDDIAELMARRLELTRYLVDVGLRLPVAAAPERRAPAA